MDWRNGGEVGVGDDGPADASEAEPAGTKRKTLVLIELQRQ
jgi:hypothetical protein